MRLWSLWFVVVLGACGGGDDTPDHDASDDGAFDADIGDSATNDADTDDADTDDAAMVDADPDGAEDADDGSLDANPDALPDGGCICDDGDPCNGVETCDADGECVPGEVPCDDGIDCTIDTCDSDTGACTSTASDAACNEGETCRVTDGGCLLLACDEDADCSDGLACNGDEVCSDETNSCQLGEPVECDDGADCSLDACTEGESGAVCVAYAQDGDGDGSNDAHCDADVVTPGDDCNDDDDAIHPGATELCNGVDDDCDEDADETFADLGTSCSMGSGACSEMGERVCASTGGGTVCNAVPSAPGVETCNAVDDDCDGVADDGTNEACYTGPARTEGVGLCHGGTRTCAGGTLGSCTGQIVPVTEICNGSDDDCDGETDEGCDDDNDNFCDSSMTLTASPTCTSGGGDCNDGSNSINPGTAELCNGINDDCDAAGVDEDCNVDGDGYCAAGKTVVGTPAICPMGAGDCADNDSDSYPGAPEICAGEDNDCDGVIDDGCDDDGDDWCDSNLEFHGASPACPHGAGDCNDASASVNPGATEVCDDVNNDCDVAGTDEGCDDDNDNYCDSTIMRVGTPTTCTAGGDDCNDASAAVKPGATEVCNGVNDDCAGIVDDGCDDDNDDYCDSGMTIVGTPPTCTHGGNDCNDAVASTHPSAAEICNNISDDCDGLNDEGCDDDNDDYCDSTLAFVASSTCSLGSGDCNDNSTSVKPGAPELCDDLNNDCDAAGVDEGCDDDNDNYCDFNFTRIGTPSTCTAGGDDCNDNDETFNPGVAEVCDTVDNNCNAVTDEACNKVFVTSLTYTPGTIGGLASADSLCTTRATAAGLTGTFRAYVSTESVDASSRLGTARGWVRMDGLPVFDSVADLTGGEMFYPLRLTELGTDAPSTSVFTGTQSNGTRSVGQTCAGMTSTAGFAGKGEPAGAGPIWSTFGTLGCGGSAALYCFQIDFTTPAVVRTPSASYKRAFVTASAWTSGTGLAGADALCASEATGAGLTGTYRAMLATSAAAASARFTGTTHAWRRLDNVVIATNRTNFFAGTWRAPLNERPDATYVGNLQVWTGSTTPGGVGTEHCASWNTGSNLIDGRYGTAGFSTSAAYSAGTSLCNLTTRRLYCLEE